MSERYDIIIVGTSFASSFFLLRVLQKLDHNSRILVLERGDFDPHAWQINNFSNSSFDEKTLIDNANGTSSWLSHIGLGGTSNSWWGSAPRFMPSDFRLNSQYGVGTDWPIDYLDLEPYYQEVEQIMQISGATKESPYPKRIAYPQPPHKFTDPDRYFKSAFPHHFFPQPSARARTSTANRASCCATGKCHLCPVNAKFTVQNELAYLYEDPRVTLQLQCAAKRINFKDGLAESIIYSHNNRNHTAYGDLIILGANALFNPHILLLSDAHHAALGRNLSSQVSIKVSVDLDGIDNFQGSTSITGHGYMLYDGPHRKRRAAALIETSNIPTLRTETGKWRQRLMMNFIYEDLPNPLNRVKISRQDPNKIAIHYQGHSDYTQRAIDELPGDLDKILTALPIENYSISPVNQVHTQIHGTTRMGIDPNTSIVDKNLRHHQYDNLYILGSGVFPSCPPAHPALTVSALSLRAADSI